jgi:hypothetical protein
LNIQGSVTFSGLSAANSLYLFAGNQVAISPNVTLTANVGDFEIAAPGAMTIDGASIQNSVGDIGITSGSVLNIENGVSINNPGLITLTAPEAVNITSDSDVDVGVNGTHIITDAGDGQVNLTSKFGSVNVTQTSIQTHFLTLNSGDSILLDAGGNTLTATGADATANLTAVNTVNVNNTDFSAFPNVNILGRTLNLVDVAFGAGSSVLLESENGQLAANPNTGAASVPGDVNFIRDVTYAGNPAQNYVNNGGGITISTLNQGGGSSITPAAQHHFP